MTWLADLGRRDYREVWDFQKKLVERRLCDEVPDTLLLVEHPEVITLGKRGRLEDVFTPAIPVYAVERGGEATYHGPGQLVGYPIFKLEDWPSGVMRFVRNLEEVIIRACGDLDVAVNRNPKQTGVWAGERKLASIGLAVKNGVTYHGFAANVSTDLTRFTLLKPCGMEGSVMTSLSVLAGREIQVGEFKEKLITRFEEVSNAPLERVELSALGFR